jgi:osmotically-inducible protein OsmY
MTYDALDSVSRAQFMRSINSIFSETTGPMKNDLLIQKDVTAALDLQLGLTPAVIGVEVHHGFVHLAGRVQTQADRSNAERVAMRVDGVTGIDADIDVVPAIPPRAMHTR